MGPRLGPHIEILVIDIDPFVGIFKNSLPGAVENILIAQKRDHRVEEFLVHVVLSELVAGNKSLGVLR